MEVVIVVCADGKVTITDRDSSDNTYEHIEIQSDSATLSLIDLSIDASSLFYAIPTECD